MMNWKEIGGLHVVAKLDQILGRWFGVELIYIDQHFKIQSRHLEKNHSFRNHLMKVVMSMKYGYEYLGQDLEKLAEELVESPSNTLVFDSFFPQVKMMASKILIDGEFMGAIIAYPWLNDSITSQ